MIIERMEVGPFAANCYLVGCPKSREGIVIDPGGDGENIISRCRELGLMVKYIINTHGHIDHISANKEVKENFNVPVVSHEADFPLYRSKRSGMAFLLGKVEVASPDLSIKEGEAITMGDIKAAVLETPGHTPGSITLEIDGSLFTGDTLFAGSIGRTDLPGGSYRRIIESIKRKILIYSDDTAVFPGHGPPTSVGEERSFNPFLT